MLSFAVCVLLADIYLLVAVWCLLLSCCWPSTACVTTVVFLRNSSVARASFLGYLLLLHLWAFAVLGFHHSNITPNMEHPLDQQLAAAGNAAQAPS